MHITVDDDNHQYDTGIHHDVTDIRFKRNVVGTFFKDNRFPNLVTLDCSENRLEKLELNIRCSSFQELNCCGNLLTELKLDCSTLQELYCYENRLAKLKLNCPLLRVLHCSQNPMIKLELNCPSLQTLESYDNKLTSLELDCPLLQYLDCSGNILTRLKVNCPPMVAANDPPVALSFATLLSRN